jgi:hypothetical protein
MIPDKPDITLTPIYNPMKEDFVCQWEMVNYTVPSRTIQTFPKWLADHIAKHLADKMANADETGIHHEDKINRYLEQIYVKL